MALPLWVQKFKEPKTEIKFIKGGYYKYQISYKYNPKKKRTDKITGVLLGKITEDKGFIPSDKNQLRSAVQSRHVDIRQFGLSHLFAALIEEETKSLWKFFSKEVCELLYSFALYRWGFNTPIKRAPYYYNHDYGSLAFTKEKVNDKDFSLALKTVGEQRTNVVKWMRHLLAGSKKSIDEFVMMDSTHVFSKSDLLTVNAKGYNANFDFEKQIRLMYLFSAGMQQPVYYRLINGNITDIQSMSLCVEEMKLSRVIYIADKGFFSRQNITLMKDNRLQFIIPLRRDNKLIDYAPLQRADFKKGLSYFTYRERIIWYYAYERDGMKLVTYLNEGLRAKEESDYVIRIGRLPEKYTQEKFEKKLSGFGTLTIAYDIKLKKTFEEIYHAYKQRNEIEVVFDSYKNFLNADRMYMQDRFVLEGWLTANFIAMLAYHKLYIRLREAKKLSQYAPRDIIERSKSIYKLKMKDEWMTSEITKKDLKLFNLIGIDYLNMRS